MQKYARGAASVIGKRLFVPNGAFVEQRVTDAGCSVAWDVERFALVEACIRLNPAAFAAWR